MVTKVDLLQPHARAADDLPGLAGVLTALIGEPFRFARVSYGDELTLHFGDLRPAENPKLQGKLYGAYVLGLRASGWLFKPGAGGGELAAGLTPPAGPGRPVTKAELEAGGLAAPDARVVRADPFPVIPGGPTGLHLGLSDGSALVVLPGPDIDDLVDDDLPEIADWELRMPYGMLKVGPGPAWAYTPRPPAARS